VIKTESVYGQLDSGNYSDWCGRETCGECAVCGGKVW
jgi:hypothetical protein